MSETSGLSAAGQKADAALKLLIEARRDCVDPAELERINHAITAAHMVIEPPSDPAKERELRGEVEATIVESSDPSQVGRTGKVSVEALGGPRPFDQPPHMVRQLYTTDDPEAWRGTPPAEGTRRKLILDTLEDFSARLISGVGGKLTGGSCLDAADAIEEALLRVVDQGATPESGSPASVAMDLLDRFDVPRTREGAILTIADRVTVLADELVETRRERDVKQATIEGLAATVSAKADALERRVDGLTKLTSRAEGKVPPRTTDLVIVLEDVSDPDGPPEYRFIELENQDGRGIGSFPIRSSERPPFKEIVIPYGRDDAWVSEVAYQVAGAATRPLLEDHPDYVFPSERVRDAVAELLSDFGIPRACVDCAEEQIGHGAKEVDTRRDATIKQLEADVERFLREREEARSGEDHWKSQRDAAFRLLQWVLPDLMGHPSDTLGADLADDAPAEDREDAPDAPDNFGLSEQARAALAARIEEGRIDPDDLIEIARLG